MSAYEWFKTNLSVGLAFMLIHSDIDLALICFMLIHSDIDLA